MKTIENLFAGRANAVRALSFCLLTAVTPLVWAAGSADEKTHTLFMGTNLAVERNKAVYPVRGVEGGSLVIKVNGELVKVPMDRGSVNLRVDQSLKLTEVSATVENLRGERAYTPGRDPNRQFQLEANAVVADTAQIGIAGGEIFQGAQARGTASNFTQASDRERATAAANEFMGQATNRLIASANAVGSFGNSAGNAAQRLQEALSEELYDAMEISFEFSAERAIAEPYVVVVARFREPAAKPGDYQNWVYAKALASTDGSRQRVRIKQGGFPPGFELKDFRVHLYDGERELATNVAPKRVPLTADEAFEYVKIEYLTAHKNATLPATPAMGRLPADLHQHLSGGKFNRPYFVKVTKEGIPEAAFVDQACRVKVEDPYLDGVLKWIRFKPALEKGRPVDAVAPLKLEDLLL